MNTKGVAPKKLKKVLEAEKLAKKPDAPPKTTEEKNALNARFDAALKIYKDLCLSTNLGPNDKIEVITSLLEFIPDEGREMLIRWRDMLPFIKGEEQNNLVRLLVLICSSPCIDSHERSITAVTLYNQVFLNVCFTCFEAIAVDKSVLVKYRIDACRYLVGSDVQENKETAQECLIEIIEDVGLPSDFRYATIAGFISKTGISTFLNVAKIKIPYDEDFVYGLQNSFFYEERNGIRERILSGQHIMDMSEGCVGSDEKLNVGNVILAFARDSSLEENVRADAADVVLRLGTPEQVLEAREIITQLGYSAISGKAQKSSLMDHVKTIYNNSQNMHDEKISESVSKFIEKMINDKTITVKPFHEIQNDVTKMVKSRSLESTKRFAAFKALNRVSIDTATFTRNKITISEIFVHVWTRIQNYKDETRTMLEDRLVEELVEMGDTCSSGHSGRFVNVLSAVDSQLSIGYDSQITANLAGRINARVRDIPDSDLRASVAAGMLPDASDEDQAAYKTFILETLKDLYEELYREFVSEKYLTAEDFDKYFSAAKKEWLSYVSAE